MSRTRNHSATARLLAVVSSHFLLDAALAQVPIIEPLQVLEAADIDQMSSGFGSTVAVDGDTALIGMNGQVGVYTRNAAGVWQRTDTLVRPAPTPAFDRFGSLAVALDGDVAVVSSDADPLVFRAHVFRRANGVWTQTQTLDEGEVFCFEPMLVIENGVIAIATMSPRGSRQVVVFREDLNGEFGLSATIFPAGRALALSDAADMLLVGGPSGEGRGVVHVYRAVPDGWLRLQTLFPLDSEPGDLFGDAIAIDDRAIVVGSPFASTQQGSGKAYEFRREGDLWVETRQLQPVFDEEFTRRERFGAQVALNDRFVMVSMPVGGTGSGMVFLYDRNSNADVPDFALLGRPDDMLFGLGLDVSGPTVFVGAPTAIGGAHGSVHVFTADNLTTDLLPSGEARAAESGGGSAGGGGTSDLLLIILLATLAARGVCKSSAAGCQRR